MSELRKRLLAVQWAVAKASLERAKKREAALRSEIANEFFPMPKKGVNRVGLDDGTDFKLTAKQTIKFVFNQQLLNALALQLQAFSNICPQWVEVFKQEWRFSESTYETCTDEVKALIDRSGLIEIKDGMPSLEIAPKPKAAYNG
jgi:hypothetical protein